jgi:CRISPR-associated protein Csm2
MENDYRKKNYAGHGPGKDSQFDSRGDFNLKATEDAFIDKKVRQKSIEGWVLNGITKETVEFANAFGEFVARNELTTSQIRTFFNEMRRIQMNSFSKQKTDFLLLKPKLAYAVKRHNKIGLKKFYEFFSLAYDVVNTTDLAIGEKHFENLMNLMEAVLAYHIYHGGKES